MLPARKEINLLEKVLEERKHSIIRVDQAPEIEAVASDVIEKKINALSDFVRKQSAFFKQLEVKINELINNKRKVGVLILFVLVEIRRTGRDGEEVSKNRLC
jgi:NAD-specific glutamate dehydrogenase